MPCHTCCLCASSIMTCLHRLTAAPTVQGAQCKHWHTPTNGTRSTRRFAGWGRRIQAACPLSARSATALAAKWLGGERGQLQVAVCAGSSSCCRQQYNVQLPGHILPCSLHGAAFMQVEWFDFAPGLAGYISSAALVISHAVRLTTQPDVAMRISSRARWQASPAGSGMLQ